MFFVLGYIKIDITSDDETEEERLILEYFLGSIPVVLNFLFLIHQIDLSLNVCLWACSNPPLPPKNKFGKVKESYGKEKISPFVNYPIRTYFVNFTFCGSVTS